MAASSTSISLIRRVKERNPDAWVAFSRLYGPMVYSWGRKRGLQDSDAADLTQEVFRSVAGGIDGFRKEAAGQSLRAWLWTITRNHLARLHNQAQERPQAAGGSSAQHALANTPEETPEEVTSPGPHVRLAHRAVEMIRKEFEEHTFQAFWRMAVLQESASDIGRDLSMSENAVRQAKFRVLRKLRDTLSEDF